MAPVAPATTYAAGPATAPTYAAATQSVEAAPSPMPPNQPAATTAAIVQPTVDVPAEFRQIVRRSSRLLLDGGSDKLRDALNRFVTLLNAGAANSELEEAGDLVADAYDECK